MKVKTIFSIIGWLVLSLGIYWGNLYARFGDSSSAVGHTVIASVLIGGFLGFSVLARERKEGAYSNVWMILSWVSFALFALLVIFNTSVILQGYTVATSKNKLKTVAADLNDSMEKFFADYDKNVHARADIYKTKIQNSKDAGYDARRWLRENLGNDVNADKMSKAFIMKMTEGNECLLESDMQDWSDSFNAFSKAIGRWNPFTIVYIARDFSNLAQSNYEKYKDFYENEKNMNVFEKLGTKHPYGIEAAEIPQLKGRFTFSAVNNFFTDKNFDFLSVLFWIIGVAFAVMAFACAIPSHEVKQHDKSVYDLGYPLK